MSNETINEMLMLHESITEEFKNLLILFLLLSPFAVLWFVVCYRKHMKYQRMIEKVISTAAYEVKVRKDDSGCTKDIFMALCGPEFSHFPRPYHIHISITKVYSRDFECTEQTAIETVDVYGRYPDIYFTSEQTQQLFDKYSYPFKNM